MSPSFRQQISSNITQTEDRLNQLLAQNQPDSRTIEGEQRELEILKRKLSALPEDAADATPVLTH